MITSFVQDNYEKFTVLRWVLALVMSGICFFALSLIADVHTVIWSGPCDYSISSDGSFSGECTVGEEKITTKRIQNERLIARVLYQHKQLICEVNSNHGTDCSTEGDE